MTRALSLSVIPVGRPAQPSPGSTRTSTGTGRRAAARAEEGWLAQEVARLSALPHTIEAAFSNAWLQVPAKARTNHGVSDEVYSAVLPKLQTLASTARPGVERDLDRILKGFSFDGLRTTSTQHQLAYCSWIGTARPDGRTMSPSDLQATLFTRCRTVAAAELAKLLDQHADALDLTLPALPRLDLAFPRWLLGDLAEPDGSGVIALNSLELQPAYQDRLARRIAAATPALRADIDRVYAARTWQRVPIDNPDADCRTQLGPLATGELETYCRNAATRWIAFLLPEMKAALPAALTAALAAHPARDENELCRIVLDPWLPGSLPTSVQQPGRDACLLEARRIIAQAAADRSRAVTASINARVQQLAAPILAAPRTYGSLLTREWFGQPTASWDGVVPGNQSDVAAVRMRAQAEYASLIAPAVDAALADARQRITKTYEQAAGSAFAEREARRLCGRDGSGAGLPPAPASPSPRDQVVQACAEAFAKFKVARTRIALERAFLRADDTTILIVTADGELRLRLVAFVKAAALAGLQVRTTRGVLGYGAQLIVTPMGADQPKLTGSVSKGRRGLLLDTIDPLPDWPADDVDTVQCLVSSEADLGNAELSALLSMLGSIFAADADRPRTAEMLMRNGLSQLQDVQSRRACLKARQAFIDQATGE